MKKHLLLSLFALLALTFQAKGAITLTTDAPEGTAVKMLLNTVSATAPVTVDWGNGVEMKYTINPAQGGYNRWVEGAVSGSTIKVSGKITEFQMTDASLTSATVEYMTDLKLLKLNDNKISEFNLKTYSPIERLNLNNNLLSNSPSQNSTLGLENCAAHLTELNVSDNPGLTCLDIRSLEVIETLSINRCPSFASLFICAPEASQKTLRYIYINDCSLTDFYPVSLPSLRKLELDNNRLMTEGTTSPFALGDYPELVWLSLKGNKNLSDIDLSKSPLIEQLWIDHCAFKKVNVSVCPELINLNCGYNNLESIDLGANTKMKNLTVAGNPMKKLETTNLTSLTDLNISETEISFVNLINAFYLQTFNAAGSGISFVDFNGTQPLRMSKVDLRNCKNFTAESMSYTLQTLQQSKKTTRTNLFLEGSNAEHSNTAYVTGPDMGWICDVSGDNTARHTALSVTLQDARDSGENKTGTLDRLYPLKAYSLDYDLDVMETTGGKFIICQWQPFYFQTIASVGATALKGVPVHIHAYPADGQRFKSVTVNGKEIYATDFIISEPSTIKVNFTSEEQHVRFAVANGQKLSFLVNTATAGGTVEVDWGTGSRTSYSGQYGYETGTTQIGGVRIEGTAAGDYFAVYGDIAAIDVSGYGDMAEIFGVWDNHITAADISGCPGLKFFNAHWNPITSIDLSQNGDLEILRLSYTGIKDIDLSANNKLMWLEMYSDGFGDDGIAMLEKIDLGNKRQLQYVDLKNNRLSSLDVSGCPHLRWLQVQNNLGIASVDLSKNPYLQELNVNRNKIAALDLSANPDLVLLSADDNQLHGIDLSANSGLTDLSLNNNYITELDLHANKALIYLGIAGNGIGAEQLNTIYYNLPVRIAPEGEDEKPVSHTLLVKQSGDRAENAAQTCDSSIALDRLWKPNVEGNNSGSPTAYLDFLPAAGGTFKVVDESGKEYGHGSMVPKYAKLTIVATPESGKEFKSYSLNGEEAIESSTFEMPGIYTKLKVSFGESGSVDDIEASGVSVNAGADGITVTADSATARIFTASGVCVSELHVSGEATAVLTPGYYIVVTTRNGVTKSHKAIVK